MIKKQRSKKVSKTVGVVIISSNLAQYSQLQRRGEKKLIQLRGAERKSFSLPLFLLHKHITSAQFNYKWCGRFNQMLSKCVNLTCLSQTKRQELFNVSIRDGNFLLGQYELIKKREIRESKRGN